MALKYQRVKLALQMRLRNRADRLKVMQIQHPIPLTEFLPAIFLEMLTDFLMIFPALEAISVMRKLTRTPCHSK